MKIYIILLLFLGHHKKKNKYLKTSKVDILCMLQGFHLTILTKFQKYKIHFETFICRSLQNKIM
jgi:hypothetical protein